jgi:hypothetical protein
LRDWVDENNPVRAVDVFVQAQFVELCRKMGLLAKASVAIDGSKFKAVNSRDNRSARADDLRTPLKLVGLDSQNSAASIR